MKAELNITPFCVWLCLMAVCFLAGSSAIAAELQGYAWVCKEKKEVCFWHKAVFDPPKGWIEDKSWTARYQAVVLFPDGKNDKSKPVIYIRTHYGEKDLALECQERRTRRRTQRAPQRDQVVRKNVVVGCESMFAEYPCTACVQVDRLGQD